jgi:hypothetical protein
MTGSTHTPQAGAAREDAAVTAPTRPVPAARQPWWLYAGVIIGALGVVSLAYGALVSPATILAAGQQVTDATRVYARYAAAYDIALAVALVVPLSTRSWRVLTGTLLQAMLAEFLLGIVGIVDHRWEQVPADIALIVIFALCARRLHRSAAA